jgi:methyl-accepting chemotaxis protein
MRFINLGLKTKIMSGSFLPVLICIFIGAIGVWTFNTRIDILLSTSVAGQLSRHTMEIERNATEMESAAHEFLLTGGQPTFERYKRAWKALSGELSKMKGVVGDNHESIKAIDEGARLIDKWQVEIAEPLFERRRGIADSQSIRELTEISSVLRAEKSMDNFKNVMTNFRKKVDSVNADRIEYGIRVAKIMVDIVVYGLLISTVLTLVISYFLASGITRHLMAAVTFSEAIAQGDLSRSLAFSSSDEIGRLGTSLNIMLSNLKEQIRRIFEGVSILNSASTEVAATVTEVATSTAQTSSALTEVATTVEQVKQSSRLASEKAKSVSHDAHESVTVAETGKRYTESTVEKMNLIKDQMESIGETVVRLSEHSQQIGTIIASVQDLADQSNLLAVNASIEAARAGEHGKGFAVVAQEIKSLADESKEATEQIRSILEDTKKWVSAVVMATEQGGKAVQSGLGQSIQAGEIIGKLSSSVLSSSQAASVIQTSSEQQFVGVEQVSMAIVSIEQAMRQIQDSINQLDPAAQRLGDLGGELKKSVQHYKL